ncbi:MAG TPA: hypothetical protein VKP65_08855 [Rhodothermales bacterium]|nr:hypothetical protein [Rhodothermales bacterium]
MHYEAQYKLFSDPDYHFAAVLLRLLMKADEIIGWQRKHRTSNKEDIDMNTTTTSRTLAHLLYGSKALLLCATLFLFATGCSVVDSNMAEEEEPTEPTADIITVTLDRYVTDADCDGIEGDGDFVLGYDVFGEGRKQLTGGGNYALADNNPNKKYAQINRTAQFVAQRVVGNEFTVTFESSEWDTSIFGNSYPDDRMANLVGTQAHRYLSGGWSNVSGTRRITNGSGNCQIRLEYTVNVEPQL